MAIKVWCILNKGLTDQFSYLIPPTEEDRELAVSAGMVAIDANVLLSLYLYSADARNDFVSALTSLNDRLWLSHQAALEFHRNRLPVINEQGRFYSEILRALQDYSSVSQKLEMRIRSFSNRAGLTVPDKDRLTGLLTPDIESAIQMIRDLESRQERIDLTQSDPILRQIDGIFDGKVGEPYDAKDYENAIGEAGRRIEARIPPGYMSADKEDPAGDYLQWDQTLSEAARRKPEYLLFVTGDQKEDWLSRMHGRVLGPRPELMLEAQQRAGCRLVIISPSQFLSLARSRSHMQVSEETLKEGERVTDEVHKLRARLQRS